MRAEARPARAPAIFFFDGAYRRLEPRRVYLHAGAQVGTRNLGLGRRRTSCSDPYLPPTRPIRRTPGVAPSAEALRRIVTPVVSPGATSRSFGCGRRAGAAPHRACVHLEPEAVRIGVTIYPSGIDPSIALRALPQTQ